MIIIATNKDFREECIHSLAIARVKYTSLITSFFIFVVLQLLVNAL